MILEAFSWINMKFLLGGLLVTLEVALFSGVISLSVGCICGIILYLKIPILSKVIKVATELIRNLPLLVLLFFTYFALPQIGIRFDVFRSSVIALSIFEGAMISEIVRSGLQNIPNGQMEAARSTGLSKFEALRYVIAPQAFSMMLPALVSQLISLIKDTSLAVIITLPELTRRARIIYGLNTSYVIPMFVLMAIFYFTICYCLSLVSKRLSKQAISI